MRVWVTGANGLLGTALKQALFDQGYNYTILGSDLFVLWKWAEQMQIMMKSIR